MCFPFVFSPRPLHMALIKVTIDPYIDLILTKLNCTLCDCVLAVEQTLDDLKAEREGVEQDIRQSTNSLDLKLSERMETIKSLKADIQEK